MRDGHYNEGEAILRMKMNLDDGNPQFWDLVAYRILKTEHHRTADEWIVYPTYDFTHCLVDSFENITHSLCTVEFRQSRESYYWLVDALEVYKPVQWEYGRLSVTNTVLSKRKLKQLVDKGLVDGWDDPRLYTLSAIRRRGVPPQAVNAFVREVGVTTADSTIEVIRLDGHIRNVLNDAAPRLIAILDPVRVRITNLPDDYCEMVSVPWHPKNTDMGTHQLPFTNTLYIERSDFRKVDEAGYFRLAPGKSVGLLYLKHPLECTAYAKDDQGNVTSIDCVYRTDSTVKPKTHIHWLAQHDVVLTVANEVRIYGNLFHHLNPQDKSQVPDGYLSDVNPDSLHTIHNTALIESGFDTYYKAYLDGTTLPHDTRFQFVRTGYFCLDKDTATNKVVFNRIVSLKEDSNKT
jgi:glutaminyl-tRNA synthetase